MAYGYGLFLHYSHWQRELGFSLLEVMLCVFILSASVVASTSILSLSANNLQLQARQQHAFAFAQRVADIVNLYSNNENIALGKILSMYQHYRPEVCQTSKQIMQLPLCLTQVQAQYLQGITLALQANTDTDADTNADTQSHYRVVLKDKNTTFIEHDFFVALSAK